MALGGGADRSRPGAASGKYVERARQLARSRLSLPALFALSALESTVLPITIELILAPWMLIERGRVWVLASVTLAGCLAAAMLGYMVGAALFESVGQWLLATYANPGAYEQFVTYFERYGFWAIVAVGILPIPFQAAMLTAGAAGYSPPLFVLATLLSRGVRYYGLAALIAVFGDRALALWQRNRGLATAFAIVLLLAAVGVSRLAVGL